MPDNALARVVSFFVPPTTPTFHTPSTRASFGYGTMKKVKKMNENIKRNIYAETTVYIDMDRIMAEIGLENWNSPSPANIEKFKRAVLAKIDDNTDTVEMVGHMPESVGMVVAAALAQRVRRFEYGRYKDEGMISDDRALAIARDVRVGVDLLKANIDMSELELLKEYVAAAEDISFEDKTKDARMFAAIEILMEM